MRQLTRITRERGCLEHDDRLESLGTLAKIFADDLEQDAEVMTTLHDEQDKEERLRKYYEEATGQSRQPSWINV